MKNSTPRIFLFFCAFAAIAATSKKDCLQISKATSQRFAGGARGSAAGTTYIFYAKVKCNAIITISEIWADGNSLERIEIVPKKVEGYKKGDLIQIYAKYYHPRERRQNESEQESQDKSTQKATAPPITFDGAALIVAEIKNKKTFIPIKSFEILEAQNFQ